ncbi:hypothetical protein AOZ06_03675 [Kibdelosporangium phytohabitans]|uniref:Uncharacterized protein n=1 Tax=Kibdelosporangium phytohabitans TaxID=860235 RepID=A0A0N9HSD1_9PSEU|nr:hypothetical protein AOZ06_03675 [Kibdelosporangium phytohabitans]
MGAPSKPGTLMAALVTTALAGLLGVINSVYVLVVGGKEVAGQLIANVAADVTGQDANELAVNAAKGIAGEALGDQVEGRAYLLLVPAALVLLFALMMNKASTGIRVTATIFAVITVAEAGWFSLDYGSAAPTLMAVTGWGAAIVGIVAIVLMWLPANGQYAKALKRA